MNRIVAARIVFFFCTPIKKNESELATNSSEIRRGIWKGIRKVIGHILRLLRKAVLKGRPKRSYFTEIRI